MADLLTQFAYETLQRGKSVFSIAHRLVAVEALKAASTMTKLVAPPPSADSASSDRLQPQAKITPELLREVSQRFDAIVQQDLHDVDAGIYPRALLFDDPWLDFLRYYPAVWLDLPLMWNRARNKEFRDFDPAIDTTGYPNYYLQNFHYQTGGYLSEMSANLYDIQVELLFNGGADAMRRRVLAPLKDGLTTAFESVPPKQIQILDVACGTGRTLKMLRGTFPQASLHGVDLSPTYLRKANELLSGDRPNLPQLVQAKGEDMPYKDDYFHGVSCVFLFHELPGPVRQQVINEAYRVLKPGGTYVIADSIQTSDSPSLLGSMEGFVSAYHEPFYRDYIQDDLQLRFAQAGFVNVTEQVHYMSKYLIAHKPA
jgi:ubiquinone/menaquinone biosynthesis C-methylase UbiE